MLDCVCGVIFPVRAADAVRAGTIPLRQAAAGCAAENMDANQPGVFGVR